MGACRTDDNMGRLQTGPKSSVCVHAQQAAAHETIHKHHADKRGRFRPSTSRHAAEPQRASTVRKCRAGSCLRSQRQPSYRNSSAARPKNSPNAVMPFDQGRSDNIVDRHYRRGEACVGGAEPAAGDNQGVEGRKAGGFRLPVDRSFWRPTAHNRPNRRSRSDEKRIRAHGRGKRTAQLPEPLGGDQRVRQPRPLCFASEIARGDHG